MELLEHTHTTNRLIYTCEKALNVETKFGIVFSVLLGDQKLNVISSHANWIFLWLLMLASCWCGRSGGSCVLWLLKLIRSWFCYYSTLIKCNIPWLSLPFFDLILRVVNKYTNSHTHARPQVRYRYRQWLSNEEKYWNNSWIYYKIILNRLNRCGAAWAISYFIYILREIVDPLFVAYV